MMVEMKQFFVFICTIAALNSYLVSFCSCFQLKHVHFVGRHLNTKKILPPSGPRAQTYKPLTRSPSLLTCRVAVSSSNIVKSKSGNIIANAIGIVVALVEPSILGGILSGGLHAVTGPDHMAALLPPSLGKSGWHGFQLGAIWGFGHGLSAIFLGLTAFGLKGRMNSKFAMIEKVSNFAEFVVGASLIAIGVIGIKESNDLPTISKDNEFEEGIESTSALEGVCGSPSSNSISTNSPSTTITTSSITKSTINSMKNTFANGILHGFSLDGAPSLLPALAMPTWRSAGTFLLAYSFGTMLTMSVVTGVAAELSLKLGKIVNDPNLPKRLSFISSIIAIGIGSFWILQAAIMR